MSRSTVLVTGATGAVGPRVVQRLCEDGYNVRTLSLDPFPPGLVSDNVESLIGDVTDVGVVRSAMNGVIAVAHLAALLHIENPPLTLRAQYDRINIGGTAIVADEACRAGVRRVVLLSTIAVYGDSQGRVLTEETLPNPKTIYAQSKLSAEKLVLNARDVEGVQVGTVLRLGAVYGSRIKGNYQKLARTIARGRMIPVSSGKNRRTLVYDRDVANAVVLALQHHCAVGRIFNVTDGFFHSVNEIISAICAALSRPIPRIALPLGPTRFLAGVIEDSSQLLSLRPLINRATVDKFTEDIAVDGSRIRKELGFLPQYDLQTGWQETIAEMRENGQL